MLTFESIDAVLDFAIEREQEAVDFYLELAGRAELPALQKTLQAFAGVELKHKEKLIAAKDKPALMTAGEGVVDLKVGDYLVAVEPGPEMSFQDALVVAMKREKAAMELYALLAALVSDAGMKAFFEKLSSEEGRHKLSFETAYEEHFLSEN